MEHKEAVKALQAAAEHLKVLGIQVHGILVSYQSGPDEVGFANAGSATRFGREAREMLRQHAEGITDSSVLDPLPVQTQ